MKNNPSNKIPGVKTGKDILNLFKAKENKSAGMNGNAPVSQTEKDLFAIWASLLGHENFGVNDDFFQIGGNSLKGVQVVSRISRQFRINIQLTDIFLHPTISELAVLVAAQQKNESGSLKINAGPRPEHIPLSFSQERLWFIDQLEGSVQYHLPAVLRLTGNLNADALHYTLQSIVNRHEALRTVFHQEDGLAWQTIRNKDEWELSVIDGSEFKNNNDGLLQKIDELIKSPFDLSKDHMLRAALITLSQQDHLLVVTMHHIASDGWSMSVLVKEVV